MLRLLFSVLGIILAIIAISEFPYKFFAATPLVIGSGAVFLGFLSSVTEESIPTAILRFTMIMIPGIFIAVPAFRYLF